MEQTFENLCRLTRAPGDRTARSEDPVPRPVHADAAFRGLALETPPPSRPSRAPGAAVRTHLNGARESRELFHEWGEQTDTRTTTHRQRRPSLQK